MTPMMLLTGVVLAAPPELAAWTARTGLELAVPPGGHVQDTPDGLALVGPGESLLLTDGQGSAGADAALSRLWAPFVASGIAAPTPADAPCRIRDAAATCRSATLEVAPGATLGLIAGQPPGADWVLVCLDRDPRRPGVCAGVIVPGS